MVPTATKAFLASTTRRTQEQSPWEKTGLRWKAWTEAGEKAEALFVAEEAWKNVHRGTCSDLDIATLLLGQVRLSNAFICLLDSASAGAVMTPRDTELSTTFFELELFQAIVLNRPIYLLVHASFEPEALGPYLDLLEFGLPDWRDRAQVKVGDAEVLRAITQILRGKGNQWKVGRRANAVPALHTGLFYARDRFARGESSPRIHFLQLDRRIATSRTTDPNLPAISDLMRNRQPFEQEQNNDRRLAFSWLLARELMVAPLLNQQGEVIQRDPVVLAGWNAALKDWHGAASWQGLHTNIHLGTLPALDTLDSVRQVLRRSGPVDAFGGSTEFIGGAYSSSYYSLAKRVHAGDKRFVLDLAQKMLCMGLDEKTLLSIPGNLAMLGSIALEAGHPHDAVGHFEAMVRMHRGNGTNPRALGEALCELAFARLFTGQRSRALGESWEGVQLMWTPNDNGGLVVDGFLVRAMFKSAVVHMRGGQLNRGFALYRDALSHAQAKHLDDQYSQWRPAAFARRIAGGVRRRFGDIFRR